jgi:hypothetical protein
MRADQMVGARRGIAALLLALVCAGGAHGHEAYFLLMFGSQRTPNDPDFAHTFATFVHATWQGPAPVSPCLEVCTISWLPRNLEIRTLALLPEVGQNFDLHTTLRYVLDGDQRVSLWGPYQIDRNLFLGAQAQARLLESGRVRYKAFDAGFSSDRVSNCIHAVSSITEGHRLQVLSHSWGETASFFVLEEMAPWVLDRNQTHPWVGSALGLYRYPIIYRGWENPHSGAVRGTVRRLLGKERDLQASYGPPR